jgi:hypothetical protein
MPGTYPARATPETGLAAWRACKHFYINGSSKGSCPYTFNPNESQVSSEIHNKDTRVPGHQSDHEGFVNAQGLGSGGSMHDLFDGASRIVENGGRPSWFNLVRASNSHQETWDGDCP